MKNGKRNSNGMPCKLREKLREEFHSLTGEKSASSLANLATRCIYAERVPTVSVTEAMKATRANNERRTVDQRSR